MILNINFLILARYIVVIFIQETIILCYYHVVKIFRNYRNGDYDDKEDGKKVYSFSKLF